MQQCIQECTNCHDVCLTTVQYCLQKGGKHAEQNHIRLLLDCAEICRTSADFMIRGSELHTATCNACAIICDKCAEDCEKFGDDAQMKACANACRRCADLCRQMAGAKA
ncbi:MAG: four-helix bundle copper-binding protein [Myxococcota bacterium]